MKDKSYFFREDLDTYKPKFKLLCLVCNFEVKKVAQQENKSYICETKRKRIKITEQSDDKK